MKATNDRICGRKRPFIRLMPAILAFSVLLLRTALPAGASESAAPAVGASVTAAPAGGASVTAAPAAGTSAAAASTSGASTSGASASGSAKLTLSKKKIVLYTGLKKYKSERLTVTVPDGYTGKIRFTSTDPSVARVSRKGKVTAVSEGTARVRVTAGKRKASCIIRVKKPVFKLRSVARLVLRQGESYRLKTTLRPKESAITYRSSNPAIATVSKAGKIQALKKGSARITLSCQGKAKTVSVTVTGEMAAPSFTTLSWNASWPYADHSIIHTSSVKLYRAFKRNKKVVAVNAGHGTIGGGSVYTLCHPNGTAKVTGGSTSAGAIRATAVSSGTMFLDGTSEASTNLSLALILRDKLLLAGYDVLMIRESADTQLDNIARAVFANRYADCHVSLHYDSTASDKGAYAITVPGIASYLNMEPVASHWREHNRLGSALISGMRQSGVKIYGGGTMGVDLTQTSYSTVPSVDVEVGDRASSHSYAVQERIAAGLAEGISLFFAGGQP